MHIEQGFVRFLKIQTKPLLGLSLLVPERGALVGSGQGAYSPAPPRPGFLCVSVYGQMVRRASGCRKSMHFPDVVPGAAGPRGSHPTDGRAGWLHSLARNASHISFRTSFPHPCGMWLLQVPFSCKSPSTVPQWRERPG